MIDSDRKPGIGQLQKMFNRCYLTVKKRKIEKMRDLDPKFLKEVLLDSYKICILSQMRYVLAISLLVLLC